MTSGAPDLEAVAQRMADDARVLLGVDASALWELEPGSDSLRLLAVSGQEGRELADQVASPAGAGLADRAVHLGLPTVGPDLSSDGRPSALCVPLSIGERVIGVLAVAGPPGRPVQGAAIGLALGVAGQAAMALALEGARLRRETQERLRHTETLLAVSQAIVSTLDLAEILRRTTRELVRALGADVGGAWLLSPDGRSVVPVAGYRVPKALFHRFAGVTLALDDPLVLEVRGAGGAAVYASDSASDERFARTVARALPHRSVLLQPIWLKGDLIGAFAVAWTRDAHRFGRGELRLADVIAHQAAMAVENARLFEEAERRRREAAVMAELASDIVASLELDTVLRRVAEAARGLCGSDMASIALREAGTDALVVRYRVGFDDLQETRIAPGQGVAGQVLVTGRPFRTDDWLQDARISKEHEAVGRRASMVAAMAVPVRIGHRVEGLLIVSNRTRRPFGDRDEAPLLELADHAAVAIRNADLYQRAEGRARKLTALSALTRVIASAQDSRSVFEAVAMAAASLLGARVARVWVADPGARVLRLEGRYGLEAPAAAEEPPAVPYGEGVIGRLFETRVAEDLVEVDEAAAGPGPDMGTETRPPTHVGLPLVSGERAVGVLSLRFAEQRRLAGEEKELLHLLADHAAIAIDKARVFAQSERRRRAAESLAAVGRLISRSLSAVERAQRIVDSVGVLVEAPRAMLTRVDPESGALEVLAVSGDDAASLGAGVVELAIEARQLVVTPDVLADPRIAGSPEARGRWEHVDVRSVVVVPLLVGDLVIGALTVADRVGRVFGPEEIRLLETFADEAAIAIHNADLYAETRRQHQEAEVLEEVARDITGSLKREEVFQRIVDRTRELTGSDLALLAPYDPVTETATIVAASGAQAEQVIGLEVRAGPRPAGRVLETGEPFVTEDYVDDPRITGDDAHVAALGGVRALVVVPLRFGGASTGLLWVAHRGRRSVGRRDLAVLGKLADQAAIALENSRLYADAQELAADRERVRLAAELHDTLSQTLFSMVLKLEWCLGRLPRQPEVRAKLEEIKQETGVMMDQLRQLIYRLSSEPASASGPSQVRQLVGQFRELTGIAVELTSHGELGRLGRSHQEILHRTLQEALANVAKHARATRVTIRLEVGADALAFEVADNGVGTAGGVAPAPGHLGLRVMLARIEAIGGRVEFGPTFPAGFRVTGRLPLT
jgi:GAF domain-containing protein/two-component sensor histidine kinase